MVFLTSLLGFLVQDREPDDPELELLVRVYGTVAGPGRDEPAA